MHTTSNFLSRTALFHLLGLGEYRYGTLPTRYAMEFPKDLIIYFLLFSFLYLFEHYRGARERQLRAAQLEAQLADAQLHNLQAQLQPHFLFNALNAISSIMYEDLGRADRMISRLSDLLRRALHASRAQEVTLGEELELLEAYLDLMRARFAERLRVRIAIDDELRRAVLPALILQPLVENAIQHGAPHPPALAEIEVRGHREGDALVLEVQDNGPGLRRPDDDLIGRGVGLTNTAERLRGLYGPAAGLAWHEVPDGGLSVRVWLPYHEAVADHGSPSHLGAVAGRGNESSAHGTLREESYGEQSWTRSES
jgi:LytS/YehU family sensor histidine kinase